MDTEHSTCRYFDIGPARSGDIPQLCELLEMLFTQEAEFRPNRTVQQRALAEIVSNPQLGSIVVARRGNAVAGMVSLLYTVSTALGGRVALLEDMVVHPDWRNNGIGTQLLRQAMSVAAENGCLRITLLTDQSNAAAQRFYQRQGFVLSEMMPMRLLLER